MPKMKLSYINWSDRVPTMTKIRQDNHMTDCINPIYIENEIELSWSIGLSLVCDEIK